MPTDNSKTAVSSFVGIEPGDIFFTTGAGLVGKLIRRGTSSPYAHCGIVVEVSETYLVTHEAFGSWPWKPGLVTKQRNRLGEDFASVMRLWRTPEEQAKMVSRSYRLLEEKPRYDWKTVGIIGLANVLPHFAVPNEDPDIRAVICSDHVADCVDAARPDDYYSHVRYEPFGMWPGGLNEDLQKLKWADERNQT